MSIILDWHFLYVATDFNNGVVGMDSTVSIMVAVVYNQSMVMTSGWDFEYYYTTAFAKSLQIS